MEKLYSTSLVLVPKFEDLLVQTHSSLHTDCFFLPVCAYWVTKVSGDTWVSP